MIFQTSCGKGNLINYCKDKKPELKLMCWTWREKPCSFDIMYLVFWELEGVIKRGVILSYTKINGLGKCGIEN